MQRDRGWKSLHRGHCCKIRLFMNRYFSKKIARGICFVSGALALSLQVKADGIGFPTSRPGMIGALGIQKTAAFVEPLNQYAYVYLKEGESLNYQIQKAGGNLGSNALIYSIYSPLGQVGTDVTIPNATSAVQTGTVTATAETAGIWIVKMNLFGNTNYWRFDVNAMAADGTTRIGGRVYTDFIYPVQNNLANIPLFVQTPSGHRYDVALNGYNGVNSRLSSDQYGLTSVANCSESLYRSAEITDASVRSYNELSCGVQNKMFFSAIDVTMPATAPMWNLTSNQTINEWLNPALTGPVVSELAYTAVSGSNPMAGNFTLKVADHVGQATLLLDLDNDGIYGGANDRSIPFGVANANTITVPFDGLGANGSPLAAGSTMKAKVLVDKAGEVHFTMIDVEVLAGVKITRTTGEATGNTLLYWDDAALSEDGRDSITPIKDGSAGVDSGSGSGVHGWGGGTSQWGNNRLIDNWAYAGAAATQEITIEGCAANAGTISR
ncbi:hypothetical protein SAMN05216327_102211 [Dyadobacter sp. SG02]|nr:hypothetical protein SAMN05216327_102211 [Dyadobacter sp. SG02]